MKCQLRSFQFSNLDLKVDNFQEAVWEDTEGREGDVWTLRPIEENIRQVQVGAGASDIGGGPPDYRHLPDLAGDADQLSERKVPSLQLLQIFTDPRIFQDLAKSRGVWKV